MKKKYAYVILTNKCNQEVLHLYKDVSEATLKNGEAYLCYHLADNDVPAEVLKINNFIFTDDILKSLNYHPIVDKMLPGSNHFPLLDFYRNNPDFDYYWLIEDDVRFNGKWCDFFDAFNLVDEQYDFITCHIRKFFEEPGWYWWETLKHDSSFVPFHLRLRSFNPIYRISNKSLSYLNHLLGYEKWSGHHEVLMPTMLCIKGFSVADFGGEGSFVNPVNLNRYYTETASNYAGVLSTGTMRFRPVIASVEESNKLYHPVKSIRAVQQK